MTSADAMPPPAPRVRGGLGAWLVACALFVRLLIPSGFMLSPATAWAMPTLIVCSGQAMAPVHAMAGHHGGSHDHDHRREPTSDHPCPFAGAGMSVAAVVTLDDGVRPTPVAASVPAAAMTRARPGRGLAAPPPPKTGPPIRA